MSKKEKNNQRHKMAVAIYREMTPEKREEYVAENIQKHKAMCFDRRAKQEHYRAMAKAGREYVRKNSVYVFYGNVGGYPLGAGAILRTIRSQETPEGAVSERIVYDVAYTICSAKDRPSTRAVNGNVGWRLMEFPQKRHPYTFTINLSKSGALIPERLAQLIRLHIELDIVTKRVGVPTKLQRIALKGELNSSLMPSPKIRKTSNKGLRSATKGMPHAD